MEMLTDKDADGQYVIPKIIYSDAYSSEMVAYADLILPDTTYLERHDCISLLDRPISEPEARAIRSAGRWSSRTATCAASRPSCSISVHG
jgi:anaerobic selenocysteine-containing dehydrogenase